MSDGYQSIKSASLSPPMQTDRASVGSQCHRCLWRASHIPMHSTAGHTRVLHHQSWKIGPDGASIARCIHMKGRGTWQRDIHRASIGQEHIATLWANGPI